MNPLIFCQITNKFFFKKIISVFIESMFHWQLQSSPIFWAKDDSWSLELIQSSTMFWISS